MQKSTIDLIRAVMSNKLRELLVATNKPSPAPDVIVSEIEAFSGAFVDFSRNGSGDVLTPVDADTAAAHTALNAVADSHHTLVSLDKFFESGDGRGSKTHQDVKRLLSIAESRQTSLPDNARNAQ